MGTILYSSPFVPAELIVTHGMTPSRLSPLSPEPVTRAPAMGMCSYAALFRDVARAAAPAGVVAASTCDQMRRCAEAIAEESATPLFLLHVPASSHSPISLPTYRAELERLGRWLVRLGGCELERDRLVALMADAPRGRPPRRTTAGGIPIALIGAPLRATDLRLSRMIESAGAFIALDATETGERCLPDAFDPVATARDPLGELARAYFAGIPDAFRRPNTLLYEYLQREIARRHIRAAIVIGRAWCDLWHAEFARLRDELAIPVIEVDLQDGEGAQERERTRIESLMEVIR